MASEVETKSEMNSEMNSEMDSNPMPMTQQPIVPHEDEIKPDIIRFKMSRLYVLMGNAVLTLISLICITSLCGPSPRNDINLGYCDSKSHHFSVVYILWIILTLIELVVTSVFLVLYVVIPKLKSRENFSIAMILYNLIQSLLHIYFWMLGTLKNDFEMQDQDVGMLGAVFFTQLNGFLYFTSIFFCQDDKYIPVLPAGDNEGETIENSKATMDSNNVLSEELATEKASSVKQATG